jgi:hypothetical protein
MFFRIITWIFVIGIIYRFLSRYVLPIFKITSQHSDRIRQMQDQMRNMNNPNNNMAPKPKVQKEGDYIDYEEVR